MNRSLTNVLFGGISAPTSPDANKIEGTITKTTVDDTVEALANADSVILVRQRRFSVNIRDIDTRC
jgi:NAD(P) transhydrogenase